MNLSTGERPYSVTSPRHQGHWMSHEYMLSCYLFPFILLFSTSSMFELHEPVADFIIFNILKLIIKIVHNIPTSFTTQLVDFFGRVTKAEINFSLFWMACST